MHVGERRERGGGAEPGILTYSVVLEPQIAMERKCGLKPGAPQLDIFCNTC